MPLRRNQGDGRSPYRRFRNQCTSSALRLLSINHSSSSGNYFPPCVIGFRTSISRNDSGTAYISSNYSDLLSQTTTAGIAWHCVEKQYSPSAVCQPSEPSPRRSNPVMRSFGRTGSVGPELHRTSVRLRSLLNQTHSADFRVQACSSLSGRKGQSTSWPCRRTFTIVVGRLLLRLHGHLGLRP